MKENSVGLNILSRNYRTIKKEFYIRKRVANNRKPSQSYKVMHKEKQNSIVHGHWPQMFS